MRLRLSVIALVALLVPTGCGLQSASGAVLAAKPALIQHYDSLQGVEITVAAKDFTEQLVLGNVVAIILNAAGASVTNMTNIPGSFGVRQAMLKRVANVSPEYTGTGWINYLGHSQPIKDPTEQWRAVNQEDAAHRLAWLPPAPMNNTYALAIRESQAERLGVSKLSDLRNLSRKDLTFCVESEFATRNDGLVPMLKAYGMSTRQLDRVTSLDTGVVYTATAKGDCNFGEVFTTDGRIRALKLRVLQDDQHFFPLYNLTEVIDADLLSAHPELAKIFALLNPRLTNDTMLALNSKVDYDGEDPAIVARDWLIDQGLLSR